MMADNDDQEINRLRGLVVKLSKEMDYKNHLLMQKEGLSLEKFATMSCLMEEKDRLLAERSQVIGTLMAQKHRLHQAYLQGMQNLEDVKLELKKVKHDLEVKYSADTNEGPLAIGNTATCLSTRDKVNEYSETMIKMTEGEQPLKRLENSTFIKDATTGKLMAPVLEMDKMLGKLPASTSNNLRNEKREMQCRKKAVEDVYNRSIMIKTESIEYDDIGSLSNPPVEPLRKKFKDSKSQNAIMEQTRSKSEQGKVDQSSTE